MALYTPVTNRDICEGPKVWFDVLNDVIRALEDHQKTRRPISTGSYLDSTDFFERCL